MKKTKKTLKIKLYLFAILAVMITALSLSSFTDGDSDITDGYRETEGTESDVGEGSVSLAEGNEAPSVDGGTDGEKDGAKSDNITPEGEPIQDESAKAKDETKESDDSLFGTVYAELRENSDKILSALSFIASVILMFFYKRGLLPSVESTVKLLASNVRSVNEATASLSLDNEKLKGEIKERLDGAERALTIIGESLLKLEEKLSLASERENEREAFKTVMAAEVDMLYEIFMAAELPHYLKENVGERISEMKAKLKETE